MWRNSKHFMEPEVSLPHSQVPATCPYTEQDRSRPYPTSDFLKIHLNIILHLRLGLTSDLFLSGFPTKALYSTPFPHTHYMTHSFVSSRFITRTILGGQYGSLSSSLCSSLHSPVISSHLSPNILLNAPFSNNLSLCSSLNTHDQVSHPHKTIGKIIHI